MNASNILVTGGTGSLGSLVVDRLQNGSYNVQALSRSKRPGTVQGDLLTGEGLEQAVEGIDVIIHCASSPTNPRQVDVEGTRRLLQAAERAGVSHIVYISIVGVDRNPFYPYYGMNLKLNK
ncbi:NAD(P)H-binding protein [Leptolyngbya sp. FACHB-671]|uniref:SDR family oxidoreductase n=1 Tax=Leptolyngbya sp. FACHB-671 TaxID=2692812 RepID=UPI0018EFE1A6|nr:NAD(P)H-binding protein [Leptolyngbya sp. FACHB-671]